MSQSTNESVLRSPILQSVNPLGSPLATSHSPLFLLFLACSSQVTCHWSLFLRPFVIKTALTSAFGPISTKPPRKGHFSSTLRAVEFTKIDTTR
jgi:hypothetical protein